MELLIPQWQIPLANVGAMTTLRQGGWSQGPYGDGKGGGGLNLATHVEDVADDVQRNRAMLRSILPAEPLWLTQVHGTAVAGAESAMPTTQADACVASTAGVVCVMMTADCLPVLFCDIAGKVVGAAHAGWRGLAAGVLEQTVAAMRSRGAGEIQAWLGPAIGAQHFEVGQDVLDAFVNIDAADRKAFVPVTGRQGKFMADIYQLARHRLAQVDVVRVTGGDLCTVSDPRCYSYRRNKLTGRMASLIWLK